MLARHWNLLAAAAENVARNGRGYAVASAGLFCALTVCLAGLAIGEGLKREALASVANGADVYCTWNAFGRDAPVPRDRLAALAALEGVERAVPRIIGRVALGEDQVLVVGVPLNELTAAAGRANAGELVDGALPESPSEVLVGAVLARHLGLGPGAKLALDGHSIRLFDIAGVTTTTGSLWSAKAVVCALEEAALVFGEEATVSDVCLYTRAGYAELVAEAVSRLDRRFRVQTRDLVSSYAEGGYSLREGIYALVWMFALALAIPAFAYTTYLGSTPRRREVGLLKAEGWSTLDVLEMVALENSIVSALVAGLALVSAYVWVALLGGYGVAGLFVADLGVFSGARVPAAFVPLPVVLALALSLSVTMTGSIYATWRTATTPAAEALS